MGWRVFYSIEIGISQHSTKAAFFGEVYELRLTGFSDRRSSDGSCRAELYASRMQRNSNITGHPTANTIKFHRAEYPAPAGWWRASLRTHLGRKGERDDRRFRNCGRYVGS